MNKYRAKKTTVDGITFDSKKEAARWSELKVLEKSGQIKDLKRQVKFEIIPKQYIGNKLVERAACYKADFTYSENGNYVVEDTKGKRTPDYIIKRKLMLWVHGIKIKEI